MSRKVNCIVIGMALTGLLFGQVSSAAALPSSCLAVQSEVDNAVPLTVDQKLADTTLNPGGACTTVAGDKFPIEDRMAVTAGVVANRAVNARHCATKQYRHRSGCISCFRDAAGTLRSKLDGAIFHGLLANAISLIEIQKASVCGAVPK